MEVRSFGARDSISSVLVIVYQNGTASIKSIEHEPNDYSPTTHKLSPAQLITMGRRPGRAAAKNAAAALSKLASLQPPAHSTLELTGFC